VDVAPGEPASGERRVREALAPPGAELLLGTTMLRIEAQPAARRAAPTRDRFGELIGAGAAMQQLYGLLELVAPSDLTVLLEGESGSGKERVGGELHRRSPRGGRAFCVADCGSSPALSEPELVGHERGAFAGAGVERKGLMERADGGTLYLDEVSELTSELQARLLRLLETRSFRRVGGDHPRKVDVRVIAATSRDLSKEVRKGRFREELYQRLVAVRLVVPPLRERREDIVPLARHFLWESGCLDPETVLTPELSEDLTQRMWPGNVGELRAVMQRATLLSEGERDREISHPDARAPDDPAAWLASALPPNLLRAPYKEARQEVMAAFDALYARSLVERHGTNVSGMAREAGVDRQLVRKLLKG
jgi:DNA-binding NtrC family response regulator